MKNSNCVEVCLSLVIACENCIADSIRTGSSGYVSICRDCADICALCARLEARGSKYYHELCGICVDVSKACAEECSKYASEHESFVACVAACKKCEEVCDEHTYALS